jgi:hypothetical protein
LYQAESIKYESELAAYLKLTESEKEGVKKPKEPKKPEYPDLTSKRMGEKSSWAKMIQTMLNELMVKAKDSKNSVVSVEAVLNNGIPITVLHDKKHESWSVLSDGDSFAFTSKSKTPYVGAILTSLTPDNIVNRSNNIKGHAEYEANTYKKTLPLAQKIIKSDFADQEKLSKLEAELSVVAKEVDAASWLEQKRRSVSENRYIAKDKIRNLV